MSDEKMPDENKQGGGPNPYLAALNAYGATAKIEGGRDLESRILLKSAMQLEMLQKRLEAGEEVSVREYGEILEFNQKLWQFFYDAMKNEDHPLPRDIKNNIASLALFMFKRTMEVMIDLKPEKLQAMIEINRNIAAGLAKRPTSTASVPKTSIPGVTGTPAHTPPPARTHAPTPYGKAAAKAAEPAHDSGTKTDSVI